MSEKLAPLRYTLLHSGLNVARLQNDDGLTGLQLAAKGGKDTSLLLMLDIFRQQRAIKDAVDVADDDGRTPLMWAAAAGHTKCVDHLLYYGASLAAKSEEGLTARDYAIKFKRKEVLEFLDDDGPDEEEGAGGAGGEAVDADGLTSTQRSKMKKKQMREAERKGMVAAVSAAAALGSSDAGSVDGLVEGVAAGMSLAGAGGADGGAGGASAPAAGPHGLLPLRPPHPQPRWKELAVALAEKRRELKVDRVAPGSEGDSASAEAGAAPEASFTGEAAVDPALWRAVLLNRLELRLGPRFSVLPTHVGHLSAMQTLILSGNALSELPPTLACLTDLKHLDLSENALAALPLETMRAFAKLEVLRLEGNRLTHLQALASCTSLVTLLADRNELTDLSALPFASMARLDVLSVSFNKLAALPEEVRCVVWQRCRPPCRATRG